MKKLLLQAIVPIIVLICAILVTVGLEEFDPMKSQVDNDAVICNLLSGDKYIYLFKNYDNGIVLNKENPNVNRAIVDYSDVHIYTNESLSESEIIKMLQEKKFLFFPDVTDAELANPFFCGNAGVGGGPAWNNPMETEVETGLIIEHKRKNRLSGKQKTELELATLHVVFDEITENSIYADPVFQNNASVGGGRNID